MEKNNRRKELGKMLMDIAKYSISGGIIGSLVTEKITVGIITICITISVIASVVGFFVIPKE